MSHINVLDSETINKIAAGEVVERPSSVVKELVENAIDAHATAITVEIKEGGISLIRVTDNGGGIDKEDIPLAFLRHSTSKIRSAEDLLMIASLGFRGEALSSIASVAQVELVTKPPAALTGVRYCIEGGEEKVFEEIGCPSGTTMVVRNLFYNTPARRKFLKSPMTEAGYVNDLLMRLSLSHPEISFKFINNHQNRIHTAGNMQLKDIIYNIYGRDITANLLKVENKSANMEISGFIGKPLISRGNRAYENYFINGRYIKSPVITKAIEEAYKNFVMVHKYPFTAFHLKIDSSFIDVNVHPTKMEIRFNNGEEVYQLVYRTIREALEGRELIPDVSLDTDKELASRQKQENEARLKNPVPEPFEARRRARQQAGAYPQGFSGAFVREGQRGGSPQAADLFAGAGAGGAKESSAASAAGEIDGAVSVSAAAAAVIGAVNEAGAPVAAKNASTAPAAREPWMEAIAQALAAEPASDTSGQPLQTPVVPDARPADSESPEVPAARPQNRQTPEIPADRPADSEAPEVPAARPEAPLTPKGEQMELFDDRLLTKKARLRHRLIGQVFETYWLVEYDKKLFIIDQHAAHEKVMYEKLKKHYDSSEAISQLLEPPMILSLTLREEEALNQYGGQLSRLGFEIEPFGGREYAVRAVPSELYGFTERDLFIDLLDSITAEAGHLTADIINDRIATMACKAAVKGNQALSFAEADALIDELLQADNPYNCPHGRPTIIAMSQYELEKKFKRIQ